jgi:nucleotide-binding universal stress UspA family protein
MSTTPTPRFVVVAAVDGTSGDAPLVEAACERLRGVSGGELHLVHVLDVGPTTEPTFYEDRAEALARLARCAEDAQGHGCYATRIFRHLAVGRPADEIVEVAEALDSDLVIVGTTGRTGVTRLVLGSVAEKVTHQARCPVLIARAKSWPAPPAIEPPCADCLAVGRASGGATVRCAHHAPKHPKAHVYHSDPEPSSAGTGLNGMR